MGEIALRPKALADLAGIWEYTAETWGCEQGDRYLRASNRAFETLTEQPQIGRLYDEVHTGLRVYPTGQHLIFYFGTDDGIDVVRVLHERMDIYWFL